MEPQIKYATTSDGVNIAYYTMGTGTPFVWLIAPGSHLLAERRVAQMRQALDGTARAFTLVRLDPRGFGLSDRDVTDLSLQAMTRDIEAVIDKERFDRVIMLAIAVETYAAIHYAASHQDKVSHLILLDPPGPDPAMSPLLNALAELAEVDWDLASATIMRSFYGREAEDIGFADLFREAVDPRVFRALRDAIRGWDIRSDLQSLTMPVLVLLDRNNRNVEPSAVRKTAAMIPEGRFVEIEETFGTPRAVARFLAGTGIAPPPRPAAYPVPPVAPAPAAASTLPNTAAPTVEHQHTAIILFADITDSTALTERLGDAAFRDKARDLNASLRKLIRDGGGAPVEGPTLGDGLLATFMSARHAIEAALACSRAGDDAGLPLHLGLHAGDVLREKDAGDRDNVYGGAVNVAARISGLSALGEVLVSETVRSLARTSAGATFEDRGEQVLKGVGEAVRVWAVREAE